MSGKQLYGELIAVRLWEDVVIEIKRLAKEQRTTKSEIVRRLLVKALDLALDQGEG